MSPLWDILPVLALLVVTGTSFRLAVPSNDLFQNATASKFNRLRAIRSSSSDSSEVPGPFWDYDDSGPHGPSHWREGYPLCCGSKQSPIDLELSSLGQMLKLVNMEPFKISRNNKKDLTHRIINTGHSLEVAINPDADYLFEGGGLPAKFRLISYHFHWGSQTAAGSEHVFGNLRYSAEMHLVGWNSDKYRSFAEARVEPDGLAVLGFFFSLGLKNRPLKALTDQLDQVQHKGQSFNVSDEVIDPERVIRPAFAGGYWRYEGSLTTPPCLESVTWTVFTTHLEMSDDQLEKLRSLKSEGASGGAIPLVDNYRPVQPLNGRLLKIVM